MDLIIQVLRGLWNDSGLAGLLDSPQNGIMILVSFVFLYFAIKKKFEPLLLVPIAFGILLANLPGAEIMKDVTGGLLGSYNEEAVVGAKWFESGILRILYVGVKSSIFPCLIFMGVGAMTDFGPMLANPVSLILGAAAQLGIYIAFIVALALGKINEGWAFTPEQAAAIAIIGGADGPTAIFLASKLAPELLAPIALAAYSYMALIPIIQPPIMKLLTTKKEREVKMTQLRQVSKPRRSSSPLQFLFSSLCFSPRLYRFSVCSCSATCSRSAELPTDFPILHRMHL